MKSVLYSKKYSLRLSYPNLYNTQNYNVGNDYTPHEQNYYFKKN